MKRLYLMRHGHAPTSAEAGVKSDALRPLSARGLSDAKRAAEEIRRRGGRPTVILHSPLVRAAQTAASAASTLGVPIETFAALDNTRPAEEVLAALQARGGGDDEILAVGHQPQVGEIACLLLDRIFELRPAGLVAVEWTSEPRLLWALNVEDLG